LEIFGKDIKRRNYLHVMFNKIVGRTKCIDKVGAEDLPSSFALESGLRIIEGGVEGIPASAIAVAS
jgi:hypothetical protein